MRASGGKMKAMDLLKSALAERQAKAQKITAETGQKWVKRGDLEQKRREEYLEQQREEEERRKADEEAHLKRVEEHFSSRQVEEEEEEKAIPQHILNEALLADDDADPPIPVSEILERLREIAQPITLFGETDMMRYRRLRQYEKEIHEGKKNPDLVMLENLHVGQQFEALRNDLQEEEADKDNDEEEEDADSSDDEKKKGDKGDDSDKSDSEDEAAGAGGKGANEDKSDSEDEGDTAAQQERAAEMVAAAEKAREAAANPEDAAAAAAAQAALDMADVDVGLMDKCDFIRAWVRKAMKAWEGELADRPEEEKKTAKCKTEIAQHRQVRRDVRPLQKRLRIYKMEEWLLDKIHNIVKCASDREYRMAAEAYLDLSIGKAAWPVGIGCGGSMLMEDAIGLHDRFNRNAQVKDIAFALNDEVTRKFVQALKRLIAVAQRYWPPDDPSKAG
mmetsp:Transcript_87249/g.182610  ORF Transcript_87249/g.182610 Transcript_87249/m.182610 type:complete len:448 (-) Transcript_87249:25-1368(-)